MAKQKSLKKKAASGMIWTTIQKFAKMGIQFISGIILARLLTPFDYGCIGMLTIFLVLAEAFIDGGFGSALIQKKRPTQVDYSTIFHWNVFLAFVMYSIIFISAPYVAKFYNIAELSNVLRVQGVILFIYALNIIQRNQLKKQLKFKIIAVIRIITAVISLIVTILMAYLGFGVWALVTQHLLMAAIPSVFFWFYIKWRPSWVFSWKSFKELFSFGFFMFLTQLINRFCDQIQGLFIGKIYNPVTMGYYSKALGTERLASHTISGVMNSVTYPLYAEVQDDLKTMGNMIKKMTTTVSYVSFPMLMILLLVAKPVFVLLYSEKWLESVPYFQVLCIAGLGGCLSGVNTQPIAAIGKSKTMFSWTIIKRIVGIIVMIGGLMVFGMKGLLIGVIINNWFSYFVNGWLVSKYIGYKLVQQLLDILPVFISASFSAIVSYFCGFFMGLGLYVDGLIKLFVFVFVYMSWSLLFKPESFIYTKNILMPIILKYQAIIFHK